MFTNEEGALAVRSLLQKLTAVVASVALALTMMPAAAMAAWRHEEVPIALADEGTLVELSLGKTAAVTFDGNRSTKQWFRFMAPESKRYTFYSTSDIDTYAVLYSVSGNMLKKVSSNDDGSIGYNFEISWTLEGGKPYYLCVSMYNSSDTGTANVVVTDLISIAQAKGNHDDIYLDDETTCATYDALDLQLYMTVEGEDGEEEEIDIPSDGYEFSNWCDDDGLIGSDPNKGPDSAGDYGVIVSGKGNYFGECCVWFDVIDENEPPADGFGSLDIAYSYEGGPLSEYKYEIVWDLADGALTYDKLDIQLGKWSYAYDEDGEEVASFSPADIAFDFRGWYRYGVLVSTDGGFELEEGYYHAVIGKSGSDVTRNIWVDVYNSKALSYLSTSKDDFTYAWTGNPVTVDSLGVELGTYDYDEDTDEDIFEAIPADAYVFSGWYADSEYSDEYVPVGGTDPNAGPKDQGYYCMRFSAVDGKGYVGDTYVGFRIVDVLDLANAYAVTDSIYMTEQTSCATYDALNLQLKQWAYGDDDDEASEDIPANAYEFSGWYSYNEDTEEYVAAGSDANEGPSEDGYWYVKVNATENGGYHGSKFAGFRFVCPLVIKGIEPYYEQTGSEISPAPVVLDDYDELLVGKDYEVSYSDNLNPGVATVKVKGLGSYSGYFAKANFTITKKASDADKAKAGEVIKLIDALPESPAPSDAAAIKAAREAYENLTPQQKAVVPSASVAKLEAAELNLENAIENEDFAKANEVEKLIEAANPKDPASVANARAAYDVLSDAQKYLIDDDVLAKLVAAEKTVAADKAAAAKAAAEKAKQKKVASISVNVKTVNAAAINKVVKKLAGNASYAKYVKTITLGKKVAKISKKAFAKCSKCTKLVLKTTKLKKAKVKGCLTGSKVKTVQVKVGNKKANKKYVKAYKKIFTKKIAGKKAKVK